MKKIFEYIQKIHRGIIEKREKSEKDQATSDAQREYQIRDLNGDPYLTIGGIKQFSIATETNLAKGVLSLSDAKDLILLMRKRYITEVITPKK